MVCSCGRCLPLENIWIIDSNFIGYQFETAIVLLRGRAVTAVTLTDTCVRHEQAHTIIVHGD